MVWFFVFDVCLKIKGKKIVFAKILAFGIELEIERFFFVFWNICEYLPIKRWLHVCLLLMLLLSLVLLFMDIDGK